MILAFGKYRLPARVQLFDIISFLCLCRITSHAKAGFLLEYFGTVSTSYSDHVVPLVSVILMRL